MADFDLSQLGNCTTDFFLQNLKLITTKDIVVTTSTHFATEHMESFFVFFGFFVTSQIAPVDQF